MKYIVSVIATKACSNGSTDLNHLISYGEQTRPEAIQKAIDSMLKKHPGCGILGYIVVSVSDTGEIKEEGKT